MGADSRLRLGWLACSLNQPQESTERSCSRYFQAHTDWESWMPTWRMMVVANLWIYTCEAKALEVVHFVVSLSAQGKEWGQLSSAASFWQSWVSIITAIWIPLRLPHPSGFCCWKLLWLISPATISGVMETKPKKQNLYICHRIHI